MSTSYFDFYTSEATNNSSTESLTSKPYKNKFRSKQIKILEGNVQGKFSLKHEHNTTSNKLLDELHLEATGRYKAANYITGTKGQIVFANDTVHNKNVYNEGSTYMGSEVNVGETKIGHGPTSEVFIANGSVIKKVANVELSFVEGVEGVEGADSTINYKVGVSSANRGEVVATAATFEQKVTKADASTSNLSLDKLTGIIGLTNGVSGTTNPTKLSLLDGNVSLDTSHEILLKTSTTNNIKIDSLGTTINTPALVNFKKDTRIETSTTTNNSGTTTVNNIFKYAHTGKNLQLDTILPHVVSVDYTPAANNIIINDSGTTVANMSHLTNQVVEYFDPVLKTELQNYLAENNTPSISQTNAVNDLLDDHKQYTNDTADALPLTSKDVAAIMYILRQRLDILKGDYTIEYFDSIRKIAAELRTFEMQIGVSNLQDELGSIRKHVSTLNAKLDSLSDSSTYLQLEQLLDDIVGVATWYLADSDSSNILSSATDMHHYISYQPSTIISDSWNSYNAVEGGVYAAMNGLYLDTGGIKSDNVRSADNIFYLDRFRGQGFFQDQKYQNWAFADGLNLTETPLDNLITEEDTDLTDDLIPSERIYSGFFGGNENASKISGKEFVVKPGTNNSDNSDNSDYRYDQFYGIMAVDRMIIVEDEYSIPTLDSDDFTVFKDWFNVLRNIKGLKDVPMSELFPNNDLFVDDSLTLNTFTLPGNSMAEFYTYMDTFYTGVLKQDAFYQECLLLQGKKYVTLNLRKVANNAGKTLLPVSLKFAANGNLQRYADIAVDTLYLDLSNHALYDLDSVNPKKFTPNGPNNVTLLKRLINGDNVAFNKDPNTIPTNNNNAISKNADIRTRVKVHVTDSVIVRIDKVNSSYSATIPSTVI